MTRHHTNTMIGSLTCSIGLAGALLVASSAAAQSRQIPGPAQHSPVIIHSAVVHTIADGTIDDGYVVFDGGLIRQVGEGQPPEMSGAEVLDASGMHLYPGLISSETNLGLVETGAVDVTNDHTELGRVTPEVRAAVAINPDTDLIPVTRSNGILTALVCPRGGILSGRCSLIRLDGWTWEDLAIDAEAGLVLSWPRTSPSTSRWSRRPASEQQVDIKKNLREIDELFDSAEAYLAAKDADPTVATDMRFEAMRATLSGEKPLYVRANAGDQIESAVTWAVERDYDIVILGGRSADRAIPILKEHDVPVIVSGVHRLPSARHDDYDRSFALPARLHEAGVRFSIASGSSAAHERNLNHNAATAAAYGLPREAALRAVTLGAAEVLGVEDRLGSIEEGKSATLILTTGDPLEITTDVLVGFIDGRHVDLGNRQKTLYAKYREKYRQLGILGAERREAAR
jgi:imidazolonepropionase-like amidohydrolase